MLIAQFTKIELISNEVHFTLADMSGETASFKHPSLENFVRKAFSMMKHELAELDITVLTDSDQLLNIPFLLPTRELTL